MQTYLVLVRLFFLEMTENTVVKVILSPYFNSMYVVAHINCIIGALSVPSACDYVSLLNLRVPHKKFPVFLALVAGQVLLNVAIVPVFQFNHGWHLRL